MKLPHLLLHGLTICGVAAAVALPAAADDIGGPVVAAGGCVPVGTVASLTGTASAAGPGGARGLACGDAVCANDTITTGPVGAAGIMLGDTLAQLGPDTTATVGRTADSAARVQLAQGGVRVVDPTGANAPGQLIAAGATASVAGNDAEAHVLNEKPGTYSLLCEWDEPLEVGRGVQTAVAAPGECVVAKPNEPLYTAPGHPQRIPALTDTCNPGLPILPLAHLDPLPPVAGGPPEGPPLPELQPFPLPSPCDEPGAFCFPTPQVNEQEPTDSPFPGSGNENGVEPTL